MGAAGQPPARHRLVAGAADSGRLAPNDVAVRFERGGVSTSAETVQMSEGNARGGDAVDTLPVTGVPRSGLPTCALVVGDPFRAEGISQQFVDQQEVAPPVRSAT